MEWPARRQRVHDLVDEFYLTLYRYAYRLSGSVANAEDLTQEAFCKAQMRLHQLRDPTSAKPWLFAILRNEYLRSIRNSNSARRIEDIPSPFFSESGDQIDREALEPELRQLHRALLGNDQADQEQCECARG